MSFIKRDNLSLKRYLNSNGIRVSDAMCAAISEWDALYSRKGRLALGMNIAEEAARLVNMDFVSKIEGGERAQFLDSQYKAALGQIKRAVEFACAKGGIVFKPYVSGGKIKVGIIQAENFIPTEYGADGEIYGAAFLDRAIKDGRVFTRIERHGFENGAYKVTNCAFVSETGADLGKPAALSSVEAWRSIEPCVIMRNIEVPLFAYFKMPAANHVDPESPLGVSILAKGGALIADAEAQYERLLWEFESGERALFVDETAIRKDRSGRHILPDKRLYRLLNFGDDTLFKDWTPELREKPLINGLNEILRRLEYSAGLAFGTLSYLDGKEKTAEEVRASNQRSYAQVCDIQSQLKDALESLIYAMDALCDLYGLCPAGDFCASFDFSDSIAADRKTEFEEKMKLLEKGILMPWEMRAWYFGEEEEAAKKCCEQLRKENDYEKRRLEKGIPGNQKGTA